MLAEHIEQSYAPRTEPGDVPDVPVTTWTPWGNVTPPANDNHASPHLVAFTGLAGSGKTTAADYLVSRGYTRVKFAGPLKDMMRAIGFGDREIEGDLKEKPHGLLCGKTPRYAMQTLGCEWGRDLIGPDFWTRLWRNTASEIIDSGGRVVTDDCRFPNEASAVRSLGGYIYRIDGRGGIGGAHASERMDIEPDEYIQNDGAISELYGRIDAAVGWAA
ncbi:MAG: deoxynucleotide monophosphate kinase [Ahrensia sp.]|nr:deoxynucleotide monophosphate kinase [Ahrensia sp.]MBV48218.1 deoxynucleotide monophosphate kinase [Roseobacter sp.]|tara:strand:- start:100519 stop:101169 length:651 start_codon:yes stop_codon:yes gene_type:complete